MRMIQTKNGVQSLDSVISEYYDPGATIKRDTPALEVWKMIEDMGNDHGITIEDCQNYVSRLKVKLIRTFKVLVCRPATEYVSIEVSAESKDAAEESALEKARMDTLDWELSDSTPDHEDYFVSDTEEVDSQYAENNLYVE